jgi:hypothetical protein
MPVERDIDLPAPTAWPIVVAFGITLLFAGLVTSATVSALGCASAAVGAIGWFREVFLHEAHVAVRVVDATPAVFTRRRAVAKVAAPAGSRRRAWLPIHIYPLSAGVKGGLAGSVAMAAVAMLYGVVNGTSVWYAVNLVASGFFPNAMRMTSSDLAAFHLRALITASAIHLSTSLLVGLLYGAMLPMLARRPILLGGFITPVLWSGLVHGVLDIVDPLLQRHLDWIWFVASQIAFGVVAGAVVSRQEQVRTWQAVPLAVRIGIEAPGLISADDEPRL